MKHNDSVFRERQLRWSSWSETLSGKSGLRPTFGLSRKKMAENCILCVSFLVDTNDMIYTEHW